MFSIAMVEILVLKNLRILLLNYLMNHNGSIENAKKLIKEANECVKVLLNYKLILQSQ